MKISAMVLVGEQEQYLRYTVESIINVVDEIYFLTNNEDWFPFYSNYSIGKYKVIREPQKDEKTINFSEWRNIVLDEMRKDGVDWVLMIDADEIFANADGSPVTRQDLEQIIKTKYKFNDGKEHYPESIDFFTRHFVWNYFSIYARQNGQHYSEQRLFRLPKGKVKCEFQRPVHERLVWWQIHHGSNKKFMYEPKRIRLNPERRVKKSCSYWVVTEEEGNKVPIIWHFGQCKGMEYIREKYKKRNMPENPWYVKDKSVDEKCTEDPLFRGSLPVIHYAGKLPEVMKLW